LVAASSLVDARAVVTSELVVGAVGRVRHGCMQCTANNTQLTQQTRSCRVLHGSHAEQSIFADRTRSFRCPPPFPFPSIPLEVSSSSHFLRSRSLNPAKGLGRVGSLQHSSRSLSWIKGPTGGAPDENECLCIFLFE